MDVTLVLTHDCNLGCGYCYAGRKFRKAMPEAIADASLDLAFRGMTSGGSLQISFFGGEPTLEWDLLVRSARDARARAAALGVTLKLSVTTNGTLLTAERVRTLAELDVYVALSIDGNQAAHEVNRPTMNGSSSWEGASRALDLLVAEGKAFETISVITPRSAPHLGASVGELFSRGVPRVSLNPCYEAIWSDDDLAAWERGLEMSAAEVAARLRGGRIVSLNVFDNKILSRLKGGLDACDKCPIGEEGVSVAPSGNLYGCERLVAEDDDPRWLIGHVTTGVDYAKVRALQSPRADRHAINPECDDCAEKPRCGAFCACANFAETGDTRVAGGVQCWHEQTSARIADALLQAMLVDRPAAFVSWFFPHGLPEGLDPAPPIGPRGVVERASLDSSVRRLPVVR
jgi:uncharacterized protein